MSEVRNLPYFLSNTRGFRLLQRWIQFKSVNSLKYRALVLRNSPSFLSHYYEYVATGILQALESLEPSGRRGLVCVGFTSHVALMPESGKKIVIQPEHTLVRQGGRDSAGSPVGEISVTDSASNQNYLVRIAGGAQILSRVDQIVEYSIPNIINVNRSKYRHLYLRKVQYIAPLLSPSMLNPGTQGRDYGKAFTFMSLSGRDERRSKIIEKLRASGVNLANIQGLLGDVSRIMSTVGVLLNLHQTDHHHTLEELRILPALLQGVLVVSEPSPLIEEVPYSKFVTFASIEEIPSVLSGLLANYEKHWEKTFASGEFSEVVSELDRANRKAFAELVGNLGLQSQLKKGAGRV